MEADFLIAEGGRRIYVHALSLRDLCERHPRFAPIVATSISGVFFRKVLFSRIIQDSKIFGFLDDTQRRMVKEEFESLPLPTVSKLLQSLCFIDRGQGSSRSERPVLRANEEVSATCFEDNYYTFATGYDASYRMYDDKDKISELRALILSAPNDPRVFDLTIIKGRSLKPSTDEQRPATGNIARHFDTDPLQLDNKLVRTVQNFIDKVAENSNDPALIHRIGDEVLMLARDALRPIGLSATVSPH